MALAKLQESLVLKKLVCYPEHLAERKPEECNSILEDIDLLLGSPLSILFANKGTDAILLRVNKLAVKVRRLDAKRTVSKEGLILLYINYREKGLVPEVYAFTENIIIMEFIEGVNIGEINLSMLPERKAREVVCSSLIKALRLDVLGVDHGQLSRAHNHVILRTGSLDPVFIDFGDASLLRRPKNFTSLWSFFYRLGALRLLGDKISRIDFARWAKGASREEVLDRLNEVCGSEHILTMSPLLR